MLSTLPKELPTAPDSVLLSCSRCASQYLHVFGAVAHLARHELIVHSTRARTLRWCNSKA